VHERVRRHRAPLVSFGGQDAGHVAPAFAQGCAYAAAQNRRSLRVEDIAFLRGGTRGAHCGRHRLDRESNIFGIW